MDPWLFMTLSIVVVTMVQFMADFLLVRKADAYLCQAACETGIGFAAIFGLHETIGAGWFIIAGLDLWGWWKHRNDDDDNHRGKRLLAWAKSKLPKPKARTVEVPT